MSKLDPVLIINNDADAAGSNEVVFVCGVCLSFYATICELVSNKHSFFHVVL